ncbi:MAG TPA: nucleotide-binding protein, partial [Thermoanaerobaculia bacterium]|nr:nucleotide-binding protein [Thermoanaerobaculia bacterium]
MRVPVTLMALVLLAGCGKQQPALDVKTAAPAKAPAASASAPASGVMPAAPEAALVTVSGTVLETMDAAEYTYMRLKTATGETWAAINKTKVAKGDAVTVTNAMVMDGFQSKTLNRTFDHILFGVLATP